MFLDKTIASILITKIEFEHLLYFLSLFVLKVQVFVQAKAERVKQIRCSFKPFWLCSQAHLHDKYGQLVNLYTKLLCTKMEFHTKVI